MKLTINNKWFSGIPDLSEEEFAGLETKILTEGFRDPIVVWHYNNQPHIVSGRNRWAICQKHDLTPITSSISFDGEHSAILWIVDEQLSKRNLTEGVKYTLTAKKREMLEEQGKIKYQATVGRKSKQSLSFVDNDLPRHNTQKEIAKALGKSTGYVAKADFVMKHADEELKNEVLKGNKTFNEAYKKTKSIAYKAKEAELKDTSAIEIKSDDVKLYNCDILAAPIKDNSLDVIITDPPYPREFLGCWSKLAEFASKKLKDGGVMIALSGQQFLPDVFKNMTVEDLNYYWTCAITLRGHQTTDLWGVKAKNKWKPMLWYVKGKYTRTFQITDVFDSSYEEVKEGQAYHKWGQSYSLMDLLVQRFTYADDLVGDPFLGGGTTGIACINNKRKFVGVELDKESFNTASKRIKELL